LQAGIVAHQKGYSIDPVSLSFIFKHKKQELYDPTDPTNRTFLKCKKTKAIEDKRTVAATREELKSWYVKCKQELYEKYDIRFNWQVVNMDETMAAVFVILFLVSLFCFISLIMYLYS
jgi:hypothetical protein